MLYRQLLVFDRLVTSRCYRKRVQDKMREFNIDEYFYVSWSREDDTTGMLCICINNRWLDKLEDLYTLIKLRLK